MIIIMTGSKSYHQRFAVTLDLFSDIITITLPLASDSILDTLALIGTILWKIILVTFLQITHIGLSDYIGHRSQWSVRYKRLKHFRIIFKHFSNVFEEHINFVVILPPLLEIFICYSRTEDQGRPENKKSQHGQGKSLNRTYHY